MNEKLTDRERVENLLEQMTLEEKISQLRYDAPEIPRLEMPAYNWWNEALHGVARAGVATVFPQAIGLAASFDTKLLRDIGDIVSTEGRAKYNEQSGRGDRDLYKGLTFWAPNVNIFRDPRWGRGQETYGEDPFLTSEMAVAYIEGLQGSGKRLKSAACAKHFAVHSGPETGRHAFDARVSLKDLAETYLPAFQACVTRAKVEGVMGAYNRINGTAACAHSGLIKKLLREQWKFDGYFVSDCGAIEDFHSGHKITSCKVESAALALKNGCDLNCGKMYRYLQKAYELGMITDGEIDQAVRHVLMTRMRLGMFDSSTEFDRIDYSENDTEAHHQKSLEAAEKSMVLLKNNGLLPLNKESLTTAAVIGPNADSREILKGNYNGTASVSYTLLEGIRQEVQEFARVYYSEGCDLVNDSVESLAGKDDRISEAVAIAERSDVVFLCLGLNASLEGEEGDAGNSYAGADRKEIGLPDSQIRLLKAVCETGVPVVLLVAAGSAVSLPYAYENCAAILHVWYPGQMGGAAAANLLFGKSVPSGKLPVTFYRSVDDLPPFEDYSMEGRTYRYMKSVPLYPFGYGLSYASFAYQDAELVVENGEKASVEIRISVTNESDYECDEITQVYAKFEGSKNAVPNYSLVQFARYTYFPHEKKRISLRIPAERFRTVDREGSYVWENAGVCLHVGGSQPDRRSEELMGRKVLSVGFRITKDGQLI